MSQPYVAMRSGQIKPGMKDELAARINELALPMVKRTDGLLAFYAVIGEDERVTTVSVYRDRAAAEAGNRTMLPWIREHLGHLMAAPPTGVEGAVVAQAFA